LSIQPKKVIIKGLKNGRKVGGDAFSPGEGICLNIEDVFHKTIVENRMLQSGDGIVVGFSGGPDSTALLHLLYKYRDYYNIRLMAAHLNHRFRPGDAEQDAEYAESFCRERGIPCIIECMDVPCMAAQEGLSPEQAGRKARYDLFNRVMQEHGFNKIAVAHNRDDQVETVLMRLIRGAGVEGLGGIKPVRGNIIRPLLQVPRAMIEEYCQQNTLNPVTDKTNFSSLYFRNRIRLELLPCLRDKYNNNIDRAVLGMARILSTENDFLAAVSREKFNELAKDSGAGRLEFSVHALSKLHTAVLWRVLRLAAEHVLGDLSNLELVHIEQMCALIGKCATGKKLYLPRGLTAGIEYGRFFIAVGHKARNRIHKTYRLCVPGCTSIYEVGGVMEVQVLDIKEYNRQREISNSNRVFLDFTKTGRNLIVTGRKEGDRFIPLGMKGTKKIKDYFIDAKVPRDKRDMVPIVRNDRDIVWVVGHRIDERYKMGRDTRQVIRLEFRHFLTGEEY
jgi:tRNA(Ile)-lysidine synthase